MKRNFAGPAIMKDEVRAVIREMKAGKATGPDGVAVEMIEALEEYGVEKLTSLLNEIYDTGEIPTDISRSVFIALPKKPGATECELHHEVRAVIKKMKAGKATGPDGVAVEMIEALEEYGVEKLTSLLNEIYDTGEIPTDISRSVFIALPKKPGATECELHRTISLMSHVTKILLRVVMMRIRSKNNQG
ncbi:LINE-1 retrotransposable element ORF2 protein [Elysia marginata]|uniref:LINE-1 retrotransposable element ORF2 protein n=1 Tax=Elysia marginata TaxID=1093978 RepID=A0AAV4HQ09_9GAST|nr:LINE-1 retrotransposable element ORF2 protein [Elysia marginata]